MRRVSLKFLIAAAISVVSLMLTVAVSYVIGRDAVNRLEQQIGRSLALLADETQDKLDRAMFERLQSLENLAAVGEIPQKTETPASLRAALERFQTAYSDYSWVGFADATGNVISATGGELEGKNVKDQTWFRHGAKEPFVGEVNLADIKPGHMLPHSHGVTNFIDLAVPVSSAEGANTGILGATLSEDWAEEVKDTLLGSMKDAIPADVIVLSEAGQVLLGPDDLTGEKLDLPSIRAARAGIADFAVERWPDGTSYFTGFSKSDGYRSYPGLRWIVLVREDQKLAFAPVRSLQRNIAISGAVFAALSALLAWALAETLSRPLLQLADVAEGLRRGHQLEFPEVGGYEEAAVLSQSLRSLVADLGAQKASLAAANQSLESQVSERTQRLAEQNVGLERAKAEAERATEAKSRFLAAASHDLRQPLHALTLFARALSRRVKGQEATILVGQMEEGLRGLKGMFDALLNVSRLDAKLIEPAKAPVWIAEIMDRVAVGSKVEADQHGLRFLNRNRDWILETDAALLETIIRNLVSNALKFTKNGGVVLAARNRGGQRVIDVYDTGPGLSPEQHERIFEEFSRTDQRAYGVNDGLGLGLSIARRYADLLGMKIQVRSRQGHGSRFTIVLPSEAILETAPSQIAVQKPETNVHDFRILVLDDDPLIVAALSRDLIDRNNRVFGYERCADAEAALMDGLAVDAAVLDFDLRSSETGLEFLAKMSGKLGRPIPAVILSGGTDSATLAALAKSGRPWLTKPADPELIVAALGAVLKGRKASTSDVDDARAPGPAEQRATDGNSSI
jgi:signal transduction histidine kinase/ActR/RegA family two-component response regulator